MSETIETTVASSAELIASGRRHLAVRDYNAAAEVLAFACETLAQEHGDTADQCAEAYLWYGKALLGLSREESGVLGDGMPGGNADEENEEEEGGEDAENGTNVAAENGVVKKEEESSKKEDESTKEEQKTSPKEDVSSTKVESSSSSAAGSSKSSKEVTDQPGTSNGDVNDDEGAVDMDNEDDIDNLQLAWETLDLARSILLRRAASTKEGNTQSLLAEVHLALGEVALESETYDKAVTDMQSCLEIQKELYASDDRRIAETHYQIGLANSLASNFDDAITHFKNAANILETRIKALENPTTEDATVKKFAANDPFYSAEGEIKELKELLPEIREKIQDMMDYKAETFKRIRELAFGASNGEGSSFAAPSNGSSSSVAPKPAASDISHLIKRKRKSSDGEGSAPKKAST